MLVDLIFKFSIGWVSLYVLLIVFGEDLLHRSGGLTDSSKRQCRHLAWGWAWFAAFVALLLAIARH